MRVDHKKKRDGFTIRKSDGVRVHNEKKSDLVRFYLEKKSNGVRVHHKP